MSSFGATTKNVLVKFAADLSKFDKAINQMQTKMDIASRKMMVMGTKATIGLTAPIVGMSVLAVKEAATMEGAMSKFNVVFRGGTEEMLDWVEAYRKDFPLAKSAIVSFSAGLQDLLVPMGMDRSAAADMTKEWMHLAGALAAFNDVPIEDALNAIRSGIAGESEPLKRFGVVASEANIKQEALSLGLMKAGDEMTAQVKQQALLSLAYRMSSDAVNGLEEQKGSLLWQTQELKATFQDFMGDIGNTMLPTIKKLVGSIQKWANQFKGLNVEQKKLIVIVGGVLAAIGPLLITLGLIAKAAGFVAAAFGVIFSVVGLVVIAIIGFVALLVNLYNTNEEFRTQVDEIWSSIKLNITSIIESIVKHAKKFWAKFGNDIIAIWTLIKKYFIDKLILLFDNVNLVIGLIAALLKGDWATAWDEALGIFENFKTDIENTVNLLVGIFTKIKTAVEDAFGINFVDTFKGAVNGLIGFLNTALDGFENMFKISVPNWVPGIGGESWQPNFGSIPQLANGGIVMPRPGGVLANIAEGGKAEAVIPLDKLNMGGNGVINLHIDISGKRLVQALGIPLMREIRVRG